MHGYSRGKGYRRPMKLQDIKTAGVVGGGTMGFGITLNFALAGIDAIVVDVTDEALGRSALLTEDALRLFVEEDLFTQEQADAASGRISRTTDLEALATQSDFVTEAVVERLKDKQELFRKLDDMCPDHTIVVSNTSGFVMSEIGEGVRRQDKIGLTHYFAPPHIVPGVEVAGGPGTSKQTYDLICQVMEKTGRVPIRLLKERPGYLLNRIQHAALAEANRLWAEGMASAEDIELGIQTTFGFRMPHEGPMYHNDLAGIFRWPGDAGNKKAYPDEVEDEAQQRIRERYAEGKPWFVDPEKFDEAVERRDREYIQRIKEMKRGWGSHIRDK
jgi:3-hydroxybutyryl-CoA dehydrogenase